ncbi:MAG: NPCBM/NEW2 domain-containing protein [Fibrobacter sp.]|jgi:4-amino-4-deoxy-L-arabinose transferase-like glycosyltransferase|nr:NPCBM/NEW2 domain-containing protein [Fibrobacter sp.]
MAFIRNLLHPAGIIGTVLAILIPFFIYLAPHIGLKDFLAFGDMRFTFPLFFIQFIGGLLLFISLFKDAASWIKTQLPAKTFLILIGIFALAVTIFAATNIEARHRVQSDESIFLSVAQNFYNSHTSGTCNQGIFEDGSLNCLQDTHTFKTKGLSFLYFLGMPLFGSDLHWIFNFHLVLLFFTILIFFFALNAWLKSPLFAAIAAFLLALQPTLLFQFRAMSVEPLYVFLLALALLVWKWALDRNTLKHWILFALLLAFFAQTRQETVFCFLAFIVLSLPKILDKKDAKAPAFFFTLSLFSVPILFTISYFQGYGFQGGEYKAHGHFIENISRNWEVMTRPLGADGLLANPFLSYFTYLAAIGLCIFLFIVIRDFSQKKYGKSIPVFLFLVLYHIQAYAIFENVSGDFTIEINQRYVLVLFPLMAFLAAIPLYYLVYFLFHKRFSAQLQFIAAVVFAVLLSANTFRYHESFKKNIMYNRNHLTSEQVEIHKWLSTLPGAKNALFVYARPYHFVGYGYSSVHYDHIRSMTDSELEKLLEKYNGEVYYLRGLDCWDSKTYHAKAVEHRIPTTCDIFEKENKLTPIYQSSVLNSYRLNVSKIEKRKRFHPEDFIASLTLNNEGENGMVVRTETKEAAAQEPWMLRVTLNESKELLNVPLGASKIQYDTLRSADSLIPGYNRFRAVVSNAVSGDTLYNETFDQFFDNGGKTVSLVSIPVFGTRQDWGQLQKNLSVEGNPLTIDGNVYSEGFGTHASSIIQFKLEKGYSHFAAAVGLDDEAICSDGFKFRVLGDGVLLYESPLVAPLQVFSLMVPIQQVKILSLESDRAGSMDCDHVNIVFPTLTLAL